MHSGKIITLSVWLMIFFNLLLSFGAVWSFQRMNPEIKRIYERNVKSLSACEDMLLALSTEDVDIKEFRKALQTAETNITEKGESAIIQKLYTQLPELESGKKGIRNQLTRSIIELTNCNKQAIFDAARKTQNLRQAGAWGIVFMTLIFFFIAIYFEQKLRRTLLAPLQEISLVIEENMQGDKFRRCNMLNASEDMRKLFTAINNLLDKRHQN